MAKPQLIVTTEPRQSRPVTTWEQRQGYRDRSGAIIKEREAERMTVKELIVWMGDRHVSHPDYEASPRPVQPLENIANRYKYDVEQGGGTMLWHIKCLFRWAMR